MKNNETEFANQDEEISYKDMWDRLYERVVVLKNHLWAESCRYAPDKDVKEALSASASWVGEVLNYMKEMEKETKK